MTPLLWKGMKDFPCGLLFLEGTVAPALGQEEGHGEDDAASEVKERIVASPNQASEQCEEGNEPVTDDESAKQDDRTAPRTAPEATSCTSSGGRPQDVSEAEPPQTNVPARAASRTPMPQPIRDARTRYKNAAEDFADGLLEAAEEWCDIKKYSKVVHKRRGFLSDYDSDYEWETYAETIIHPPCSYVALARIVMRSNPDAVSPSLLSSLSKEIAGRELVDEWFAELPEGDPQKQTVLQHQSFTDKLRETQWILERAACMAALRERA